jgi:hypothetical protein
MTLLTVDEFREHVATSLGDDAVGRLLDDAEAQIVAYAGSAGSVTELVDGGFGRLSLSRPTSSVTSITETVGTTSVTLATDDWRHRGAYVLERLNTGTNARWTWNRLVTVVYTPDDDSVQRKAVQLELVKLEIAFTPGLAAETVGSWTQQYVTSGSAPLSDQRSELLARLRQPSIGIA